MDLSSFLLRTSGEPKLKYTTADSSSYVINILGCDRNERTFFLALVLKSLRRVDRRARTRINLPQEVRRNARKTLFLRLVI